MAVHTLNPSRRRIRTRQVVAAVLVFVLLAAGLGTWAYRRHQLAADDARMRRDGLAAAGRGDVATAVYHLQPYLRRNPADAEVLEAYAQARLDLNDEAALPEVAGIIRSLLQDAPDRSDLRRELLDVYGRAGMIPEAKTLAEEVLARTPDDPTALRVLTTMLQYLRQDAAAAATAKRWAAASPNDVRARRAELSLSRREGAGRDELLAMIGSPEEGAAGDAQAAVAALMRGYALLLTADAGAATRPSDAAGERNVALWLDRATAQDPPDADFALMAVDLLDATHRGEEALTYLRKAADEFESPQVRRALLTRLWQRRAADELADRLKRDFDVGLPPDEATTAGLLRRDPALLAFAADALAWRGDAAAAKEVRGRMAVSDSPVAIAWAASLRAEENPASVDAADWRRQADAALAARPGDAALALFAGRAAAQAGDLDAAERDFRDSTSNAPPWALPATDLARLLARRQKHGDALRWAFEAARRQPTDVRAAVTLVQIWSDAIDNGAAGDESSLLGAAESLQHQLPNEPNTLAIYVDLLARSGRAADAAAAVRGALSADVPAATLLRLAQVSRRRELGQETALLDQVRRAHGVTLDLSQYEAMRLLGDGDPAAGFDRLRDDRNAAAPAEPAERARWAVAMARYEETAALPGAEEAWRSLSETYAADPAAQRAVLASGAGRQDRDLARSAADRLRAAAGEGDPSWQLAEAGLLLDDPSNRDAKDRATRAVALLDKLLAAQPNLAPALVRQGQAYDRLDNLGAAVERLTRAHRAAPDDAQVTLYLAEVLQRQGNLRRAEEVLGEMTSSLASGAAEPRGTRRQTALLLAKQGRLDEAAALLGEQPNAAAGTIVDVDDRLLLANLNARRGDVAGAEAELARLLGNASIRPPVRVAALALAADLAMTRNDRAAADARLAELDAAAGAAAGDANGNAALIRADLTFRRIDQAKGLDLFEAATTASPGDAAVWLARLTALAAAGRPGETVALLPEAARLTGDPALGRAAARRAILAPAADRPFLRDLAVAWLRDPDDPAASAALSLFADGGTTLPAAAWEAGRLEGARELARQHPRSEEVQLLMVEMLLRSGDAVAACDAAAATAAAFPLSAAAARAAALTAMRAGRWAQAEGYAQQWAALNAASAPAAELVRAEALVRMNRPAEAVALLEPRSADARASIADGATAGPAADLLIAYAAALVQDGQNEPAAALIEPLIASSPKAAAWRVRWAQTAAADLPEQAAAAWLQRLVALAAAAGDVEQLTRLADAWDQLGGRSGNDAYSAAGRQILAQLRARSGSPVEVTMLLASQYDRVGDLKAAEELYRAALAQLDADGTPEDTQHRLMRAILTNNLAMVLARAGGRLEEAVALGKNAVELQDDVASFRDTLAHVLSLSGRFDDALASADRAVELSPDELEFRINRAQILLDAGRPDRAAEAVDGIAADARVDSLSLDLRTKLDALRRRAAAPEGAGGERK